MLSTGLQLAELSALEKQVSCEGCPGEVEAMCCSQVEVKGGVQPLGSLCSQHMHAHACVKFRSPDFGVL